MNAHEDTPELRQSVIEACRRLRARGHFVGTWGNIGVRLREGLLVTPTRLDYDLMEPDDLVALSWEGRRLSGYRLPSSEADLHRLVLHARGDLGATIHTHSPYATVVAAARKTLPVIVEDMAQSIGGEVRTARYVPGGHHRELAEACCEALGTSSCAALLANHGAVVGGRDLSEAVAAAEVLEKAALVYVLSQPLGGAVTIPPELAAEERDRFLHRYGTAADQPPA